MRKNAGRLIHGLAVIVHTNLDLFQLTDNFIAFLPVFEPFDFRGDVSNQLLSQISSLNQGGGGCSNKLSPFS